MTLIEAFTRPQRGARQPVDQVLPDVGFTERRRGAFPVIFLIHGIGNVSIEIKLLSFLPQLLAQLQFRIGFTFVTKTVFTLSAGCFEALLLAAAAGPANAGTRVAMEIDSQRLSRHHACCDGDRQRSLRRVIIILSPEIIAFLCTLRRYIASRVRAFNGSLTRPALYAADDKRCHPHGINGNVLAANR